MKPARAFRPGLLIAALVTGLDQLSKWWIAERVMRQAGEIELTPFFSLVHSWNRGISFGLFNSDSPHNAWVLAVLAGAICAALLVWLARSERLLPGAAIGMIIGGALGNVIDRLRFGAVFDFLDVHWGGYHWPAFNLADSAITVGAVILVAESLLQRTESR